ncbi:MAG: hypothetical protein AAB649_06385 [Patescibacteria group bacterium]
MESEPTHHTTLIVFGGALLAAVIVAVVIYFLPSKPQEFVQVTDNSAEPIQEASSQKNFDTSVLQRSEYKDLDASLFTRGLLPVVAPTGTGKTNLFR